MQASSVMNLATKPLIGSTPSASELSTELVNNELKTSAGPESGKPSDADETRHEELQTMVKKVSKMQKKTVQAGQFNFAELLGDINYLDSEQKQRKTSSVKSDEQKLQVD